MHHNYFQSKSKFTGFTLLEILIVIAMIGLLAGIGIPIYQSFQVRNDLHLASSTTAETLRRAQALTLASQHDSPWGVYIESGGIVLFQGASYASRNSGHDEAYTIPTSITPSGLVEITFSKIDGEPSTTGTITLASLYNGTKDITINEKGTVSY